MKSINSYVYFALKGKDFDPSIVTKEIGLYPTEHFRKGDKGKYNPSMNHSCWKLSTEKGIEPIHLDILVTKIIDQLYGKIDIINKLKKELDLTSVIQIVMDIDFNPDESTPALGHDLKTIEFLYKTKTTTDIDIYRVDSTKN